MWIVLLRRQSSQQTESHGRWKMLEGRERERLCGMLKEIRWRATSENSVAKCSKTEHVLVKPKSSGGWRQPKAGG